MMKVLAVNSSPKMARGNTALILNPFLEGMREVGAEVELFYTRRLKVNPCQGCFNCWRKTPGRCRQEDDMQMLLPKLREADILVLATPVHAFGVSGPMKNLMDRTLPLAEPFLELRDGHSCHPLGEGQKHSKVVLVSSCALWERDNFDSLLVQMRALPVGVAAWEFAGALLRPHAEEMRPMIQVGLSPDDIFEAAKEAGRQMVRDGEMSPEILDIVSRELVPLEEFIQKTNAYLQHRLEALRS